MKTNFLFKIAITSLLSFLAMQISYSASLLEVYQRALQSDPMIHEAESRRLAALEGETQARSFLLPELSIGSRYTIDNFDGSSVEAGAAGSRPRHARAAGGEGGPRAGKVSGGGTPRAGGEATATLVLPLQGGLS